MAKRFLIYIVILLFIFINCNKTSKILKSDKIVKKSEFDTSDYHIQIANKLLNKYSKETNQVKKEYYLKKAESELNRAKALAENDGEEKNYKLYNNLGILAYYKNDNKKAIKNFGLSQKLNSTNTESYLHLGKLYFKAREGKDWQQKAEDNFYKVLNKDLNNIEANYYMGKLHYEKLEFDKAKKYLDKIIQIEKVKKDFHYTDESKKILNNIRILSKLPIKNPV